MCVCMWHFVAVIIMLIQLRCAKYSNFCLQWKSIKFTVIKNQPPKNEMVKNIWLKESTNIWVFFTTFKPKLCIIIHTKSPYTNSVFLFSYFWLVKEFHYVAQEKRAFGYCIKTTLTTTFASNYTIVIIQIPLMMAKRCDFQIKLINISNVI